MKRALVTGACGFIGRYLAEHLVREGYQVIATDAESCKLDGVQFIQADLSDKNLNLDLSQVDCVFHLAAIFDYSVPYDKLYKVNVEGTRNLLNNCLKYKDNLNKIFVWSSGSIYKFKETPCTEKDDLAPKNNYEKSKLEQEKIALEYAEKGLPIIVLRLAAVYGPRSKYGIFDLIYKVAKGQIPFLLGKKGQRAAVVSIFDVVGAAEFLALNVQKFPGIFNIVDDQMYTSDELMNYLSKITGGKLLQFRMPFFLIKPLIWWAAVRAKFSGERSKVEKDAAGYLKRSITMSNKKLKDLGYKFKYSDTKEGLKETIKWYKEHNIL